MYLLKNSDIHNHNTRSKNNLHRYHTPKQYSRLCLRYTLVCLDLKINEKTYNHDDYHYVFNTDRLSKLLSSKPVSILSKIYTKIQTHSLAGYKTYVKNIFIDSYSIK